MGASRRQRTVGIHQRLFDWCLVVCISWYATATAAAACAWRVCAVVVMVVVCHLLQQRRGVANGCGCACFAWNGERGTEGGADMDASASGAATSRLAPLHISIPLNLQDARHSGREQEALWSHAVSAPTHHLRPLLGPGDSTNHRMIDPVRTNYARWPTCSLLCLCVFGHGWS